MKLIVNKGVAAALTVALLLLAFAYAYGFVSSSDPDRLPETLAAKHEVPSQAASVLDLEFADDTMRDEVLWLARVIYSETKRADEQELVAWVLRNRVETQYRGATTYQQVALDPWQFSAFNRNAPKRVHYSNLDLDSRARGWHTALFIAYDVLNAPAYERPFPETTRHFYSERSMVGRSAPAWARGQRPVSLDRPVDPRRFRFYSGIS